MRKLFKSETFLYLFFGGWTTLVNYGVFYLFYELCELRSTLANFIAFIAALIFSFVTNKLFVFKSRSFALPIILPEISQYTVSRLFTFFMEEAGLFVCEDVFAWDRYELFELLGVEVDGVTLAKIILAVVGVIINYIFCKLLVFKKESK